MESVFCGIATKHARGEFGRRIGGEWFFSQFLTPFLYEKDGKILPGEAGDLMIVPPHTPVCHGPTPDAQEGFSNDWVYLRGEELPQLLERYPLPLCTAFSVPQPGIFHSYIEAVKREHTERRDGCGEKVLYLTGQLVIDLHRALAGTAEDALLQIREAILHHPEHPWTLAEMAAQSGYSVSRFSALYRARFGKSPKQELLQARLELACGLLRYGGMTVSEVAYACGFRSIYYFSNYFRTATGMSPKAYAEQS